MKITICNRACDIKEAVKAKKQLKQLGHEALTHEEELELAGKKMPVEEFYHLRRTTWNKDIEELKKWAMMEHFKKIMDSEAILVLNFDKPDIKNYIGGNVLMEMAVAFALDKKIFLLNPAPENLSYTEEIKGVQPIIINGDLKKIR